MVACFSEHEGELCVCILHGSVSCQASHLLGHSAYPEKTHPWQPEHTISQHTTSRRKEVSSQHYRGHLPVPASQNSPRILQHPMLQIKQWQVRGGKHLRSSCLAVLTASASCPTSKDARAKLAHAMDSISGSSAACRKCCCAAAQSPSAPSALPAHTREKAVKTPETTRRRPIGARHALAHNVLACACTWCAGL